MSPRQIVEAFADLPDQRRRQGRRHSLPLCLALFTLAVAAGNQGFLAIDDWLKSYHEQLSELFGVEKHRLPSYSTIRRILLSIEYQDYAASLAKFLNICPETGETIAIDGKVVRGSFMVEKDNPNCESHPAIMLVSAYLVERGLILQTYEVEKKTNEIKSLPEFIKILALKGVVFAFDAINPQKNLPVNC